MCPSTNELPFSFSTQECTLQRPHLEFLSCSSACSQGRQSNPACHVSAPVLAFPPPRIHPTFLLHLLRSFRSSYSVPHPPPLPFPFRESNSSSHSRCECTLQSTHLSILSCCSSLSQRHSSSPACHVSCSRVSWRSLLPPPTLLLHASASASARATLFHLQLQLPPPFSRLQLQLSSSPLCTSRVPTSPSFPAALLFSTSQLQLSFDMLAHQLLHLKYASRSPQLTFIMLAHQLPHLKYTSRFPQTHLLDAGAHSSCT